MKISTQSVSSSRSSADNVGQLKKGSSGVAQNMAIQRNAAKKDKKK